MKKRIAFIINPISGGIDKRDFPDQVRQYLDHDIFDHELFYTGSSAHNRQLAASCAGRGFDVIVAVGGDGTINNTAAHVAGTGILFGIVPQGSGNGLARHLGISSRVDEAISVINSLKSTSIDTGMANDSFFLNVAGVGFDAHVSRLFAVAPHRGFWQYAKITLREFNAYKARHYSLTLDGKTLEREAFILCAANGSQYGNNAYIAPFASVNDGLLEVTIIKPFNLLQAAALGFRMFNRSLPRSPLVEVLSCKHLSIRQAEPEVMNIDGEPVNGQRDIEIRVHSSSLKILVP